MNEYIDPMKPLIEKIMTNFRIEEENHILKAVQSVGIVVDKDRLVQALTDAKKFYEEGYVAGSNSVHRHGMWVERIEKPEWLDDDVEIYYECSACGCNNFGKSPYCPNCGTKMDGKDGAE